MKLSLDNKIQVAIAVGTLLSVFIAAIALIFDFTSVGVVDGAKGSTGSIQVENVESGFVNTGETGNVSINEDN